MTAERGVGPKSAVESLCPVSLVVAGVAENAAVGVEERRIS